MPSPAHRWLSLFGSTSRTSECRTGTRAPSVRIRSAFTPIRSIPSTSDFTIQDPKKALALPALSLIQLNDHTANEVLFTGYLQRRNVVFFGGKVGYAVEATAIDYSSLLDMTIMPALKTSAGASDQTLIQSVVNHSIRHKTIHCHHNLVTSTNSN